MKTVDPLWDEDDILVAEYVVGVLPGEERRLLEERILRDPVIKQRVAAWEARMEDLNDDYGHLAAPRAVKAGIDQQLFSTPRRKGTPWSWLAGAMAAVGSVAVALVLLIGTLQQPELQAALTDDDGSLIVTVEARGNTLTISQVAMQPPAGSVLELWAVRPGEVPQSLGTFGDAGDLLLPAELAEGGILAVSIEPAGGSPSDGPTGPIIATGVLQDA